MKKENALKYKAGRKYNNSEKDNGKALTQEEHYNENNNDDFGIESHHPISDQNIDQNQTMNIVVGNKNNTKSRNSSQMNNYKSTPLDDQK